MALTNLPSASEIRLASRLLPKQVSVAFSDEIELDADIAPRIEAAADKVEERVQTAIDADTPPDIDPPVWPFTAEYLEEKYPTYDATQIEAIMNRQQKAAGRAVEKFALHDLYDSAGQLNPRYQAEADNYERRAESEMEILIASVKRISSRNNSSTEDDSAQVLTIVCGEDFAEDEYACD